MTFAILQFLTAIFAGISSALAFVNHDIALGALLIAFSFVSLLLGLLNLRCEWRKDILLASISAEWELHNSRPMNEAEQREAIAYVTARVEDGR